MSCFKIYTLKLNGKTIEVPSSNIEEGASIHDLIQSLNSFKETNKEQFDAFISELNVENKVKKPDSRRNKDLPYIIKNNLKKYGIDIEVMNETKWNEFCESYNKNKQVKLNKSAKSFFLDGKIYVRESGFKVEDAIHELSHFILAVMRCENFNDYLNFIDTMYKHPKVKEISKTINSIKIYSDNHNLDFKEECVVRYIEGFMTENSSFVNEFKVNDENIDTVDFLNKSLSSTIRKIFNLKQNPGIITLFKSLVKDVPLYGSEMFITKSSSIGYKDMKLKAIKALQISALINYYLSSDGGNLIQKGECI